MIEELEKGKYHRIMNLGDNGIVVECRNSIPVDMIESEIYRLERGEKKSVSEYVEKRTAIEILNNIVKQWG